MSQRSILVEKLAETLGTTKSATDAILLAVVNAVRLHLAEHGQAVLPGFGRLKAHTRASRQGRNPRTGASITVPAKTVTKFVEFPSSRK